MTNFTESRKAIEEYLAWAESKPILDGIFQIDWLRACLEEVDRLEKLQELTLKTSIASVDLSNAMSDLEGSEIKRLKAQLAKCREALRPFAYCRRDYAATFGCGKCDGCRAKEVYEKD